MINHFPGAHYLHAPVVSNWRCRNKILPMEHELSQEKCGEESIERYQSNISTKESLRIQCEESED